MYSQETDLENCLLAFTSKDLSLSISVQDTRFHHMNENPFTLTPDQLLVVYWTKGFPHQSMCSGTLDVLCGAGSAGRRAGSVACSRCVDQKMMELAGITTPFTVMTWCRECVTSVICIVSGKAVDLLLEVCDHSSEPLLPMILMWLHIPQIWPKT